MMLVIMRGRRMRRFKALRGKSHPRTWHALKIAEWDRRTAGSAKTGRGGRRKRRRRGRAVANLGRVARLIWSGGPDLLSRSTRRLLEAQAPKRPTLGRRERRRRAKLRRRRARAIAERRRWVEWAETLTVQPPGHVAEVYRETVAWAEQKAALTLIGSSERSLTPGA